jgi:hypothetical protein
VFFKLPVLICFEYWFYSAVPQNSIVFLFFFMRQGKWRYFNEESTTNSPAIFYFTKWFECNCKHTITPEHFCWYDKCKIVCVGVLALLPALIELFMPKSINKSLCPAAVATCIPVELLPPSPFHFGDTVGERVYFCAHSAGKKRTCSLALSKSKWAHIHFLCTLPRRQYTYKLPFMAVLMCLDAAYLEVV